ncbi:hypothetical protein VTL71DRAFT_15218 [Oculimacula yallundae]|uniref:Uncharacterized protein n=1 Tax=Oculimacula yallundae TaxID=86028 RepID=A0ABR4CFY1_9HELO
MPAPTTRNRMVGWLGRIIISCGVLLAAAGLLFFSAVDGANANARSGSGQGDLIIPAGPGPDAEEMFGTTGSEGHLSQVKIMKAVQDTSVFAISSRDAKSGHPTTGRRFSKEKQKSRKCFKNIR